MAENVLTTRIQLRYGTYDEWASNYSILKSGEAAVCSFPNQNPPAVGIKFGDGVHTFIQLPWLQALAADVYGWAKKDSKPTYTAEEIEGLKNYIETHAPGGGSSGGGGTATPRLYQIVQGTGDNINKYYLQYRDDTDGSQWILDTSHYIDVGDFVNVKNWIGNYNLTEYPDLSTAIVEWVLITFNSINYSDTEIADQFVTSVSQNKGKISVSRAKPSFSNLNGVADVVQGGTGVTTLPSGQVLIGNGTSPITSTRIATDIENNNDLVPNYLIKQYVDNATNGIANAMHFIGEATVVIRNNSSINPNIAGYIFSRARPGDVILYEEKEFIWDGSVWRLLGDEGSYAVKGEIKDSDINSEAAISQDKIANLVEDLDSKVDKIDGKSLSTNDYSTEEKTKLATIEEGAQRNLIEHIFVNDREQIPTTISGSDNSIALSIDVFDEEHAEKLDGIQERAQVNTIEHILLNGTEISPMTVHGLDKSVNLLLTLYTELEKTKLAEIEAGAEVNKVESISINGTSFTPDQNKNIEINLDPAVLKLTVIEGARYPSGINTYTSIEKDSTGKILELSKIAATGNVDDLLQTSGTYLILNCGTSLEVI